VLSVECGAFDCCGVVILRLETLYQRCICVVAAVVAAAAAVVVAVVVVFQDDGI